MLTKHYQSHGRAFESCLVKNRRFKLPSAVSVVTSAKTCSSSSVLKFLSSLSIFKVQLLCNTHVATTAFTMYSISTMLMCCRRLNLSFSTPKACLITALALHSLLLKLYSAAVIFCLSQYGFIKYDEIGYAPSPKR